MASRSRQRAEEAIADLKRQTGKEAIFLELDLANLKAIKKAAESFSRFVVCRVYNDCQFIFRVCSQETQLHVLFNSGCVPDVQFQLI